PAVAVPSSCCGWEPMLDEADAEIFRSIRASGRPPAPTAEARPLAPPSGDRPRPPRRLGRHDLRRSWLLPHGLSEPAQDLAPRLALGTAHAVPDQAAGAKRAPLGRLAQGRAELWLTAARDRGLQEDG